MDSLRLTYNSSISDLHEVNSSFDAGVLQICYTGANRNKTYFSKNTLERSIPTIYNCPIVANYNRDTGTMGGHDVEVITDYDDKIRMVNITQPVGVIPESANIYFKDVEEEDGTVHEYLCADVILWKRQEAYKAIKESGITSESMEINVKDGERVDDVYVINDFEFTAFALLGDCEPCFESASLQVFSVGNEFKEQFAEMMAEFKETFNLATTSAEVDDKNLKEGGSCQVQEENKEVFEAEVDEKVSEEVVDDVVNTEADEESYALNSNMSEAILEAFSGQTISTDWGEVNQYFMADYDVEANMVYAWDVLDWLLYGFNYEMNGDNVVIDFDSKKRMKYVIAEFDEGETQTSPFAFASDEMAKSLSESKEEYSNLESQYNEIASEVRELREFKSRVESEADQTQRDELFAQFSDLNDVEEFTALVADSSEYDLSTLEEKCYAIRGRNVKMNFSSKESKAPRLLINPEGDKSEEKKPYNGIVEKYLGSAK